MLRLLLRPLDGLYTGRGLQAEVLRSVVATRLLPDGTYHRLVQLLPIDSIVLAHVEGGEISIIICLSIRLCLVSLTQCLGGWTVENDKAFVISLSLEL